MSKQRFTYHSDGGHGWLQVDTNDLVRAGLSVQSFSQYSYQSDDMDVNGVRQFFLEEDRDAGIFMDAFVKVNSVQPDIKDAAVEGESLIRNLERIL